MTDSALCAQLALCAALVVYCTKYALDSWTRACTHAGQHGSLLRIRGQALLGPRPRVGVSCGSVRQVLPGPSRPSGASATGTRPWGDPAGKDHCACKSQMPKPKQHKLPPMPTTSPWLNATWSRWHATQCHVRPHAAGPWHALAWARHGHYMCAACARARAELQGQGIVHPTRRSRSRSCGLQAQSARPRFTQMPAAATWHDVARQRRQCFRQHAQPLADAPSSL